MSRYEIATSQVITLTGKGTAVLTGDNGIPTGTQVSYISYATTQTLSQTTTALNSSSISFLTGGNATTTSRQNVTATTTTSSITPSNTQPCNQYVEFCGRKYSNITYVAAHNFAFAKQGNVQSNQKWTSELVNLLYAFLIYLVNTQLIFIKIKEGINTTYSNNVQVQNTVSFPPPPNTTQNVQVYQGGYIAGFQAAQPPLLPRYPK